MINHPTVNPHPVMEYFWQHQRKKTNRVQRAFNKLSKTIKSIIFAGVNTAHPGTFNKDHLKCKFEELTLEQREKVIRVMNQLRETSQAWPAYFSLGEKHINN